MTARLSSFARTATVLSRNPLGLLALCLVIGEAIAGMFLLHPNGLHGPERLLLCGFVVGYPLCVVAAIYRLVSRHHTKLYAPADFRDERCFLEVLRQSAPDQPPPLASTAIVEGDDFFMIIAAPAANGRPWREPGVYLVGGDAYCVTRRQQIYLLRRAGAVGLPHEVHTLPGACRLLPRHEWDGELQLLADAAERIAGR